MKTQTAFPKDNLGGMSQYGANGNGGFFSKVLNLFSAKGKHDVTLVDHLSGLRACLDNLQMNVFVADQNFNLVYGHL